MEQIEVTPNDFNEILDLTQYAHSEIATSLHGHRAYWVTVGPELAKKLLATYSVDYRKLRPKHVATIAEDMRNGEFDSDNGSAIRIDKNGNIADGQHRMTGIQETGKRLEFLIVDSLPPETYDRLDTNALTRTYVDVLRKRGVSNPTSVMALTRHLHKWYNPKITSLDTNYRMSVPMLDNIYYEHKEHIQWAVHNSSRYAPKIDAPQRLISLVMFVLGEVSKSSIKGLIISVAEGENIHRGMPAYTLRTRLDLDDRQKKRRDPNETMYLFFRAWQTYNQNLMRHESNQLQLHSIPLPVEGVSIRDLKEMMATDNG